MYGSGPHEFNFSAEYSAEYWGSTVPKHERLTLKALADELELSTCTVSRVLNGKGEQYRIAEVTKNRVLEHARVRGFSPNLVARGLRMKKTNAIGLVLPDLSNPFFAKVARSVADEAHRNKYTLEVCDSQDSTDLEIEILSLLRDRQVDGMVLCPVGNESKHLISLALGDSTVVMVDRYFANLKLPYVSSDNVKGAESATQHLIDYGHRQIACLQGLPSAITNVHRLDGFRRALRSKSIRFNKKMILGDGFTLESGYLSTRNLIKQDRSVTAILALSNQIALGALKAIAEAGLSVPEDISLVTFDTIEGVEFFATPLTTVSQSAREIGERAAVMLFERIQNPGEHEAEHIIMPTKLTSRQSVKRI